MSRSLPRPDYRREGVSLYLGDCNELLPLMGDGSIDMICTDPPYGHGTNSDDDLISRWELALGAERGDPPRPIASDDEAADGLARFLFRQAARLLRPGGCCCCCCGGGGGPSPQFAKWSLWMGEQLAFKQMVVWDKGPMGMGWHYRRSYETILVGTRRGGKCRWFDSSGRVENIIRPGRIPKIIPSVGDHPTAKPVSLYGHFISLHTTDGELVLDPFMGAGPGALACLWLGRRYVGIEIDRQWFDIAASRVEKWRPPTASSAGIAAWGEEI